MKNLYIYWPFVGAIGGYIFIKVHQADQPWYEVTPKRLLLFMGGGALLGYIMMVAALFVGIIQWFMNNESHKWPPDKRSWWNRPLK